MEEMGRGSGVQLQWNSTNFIGSPGVQHYADFPGKARGELQPNSAGPLHEWGCLGATVLKPQAQSTTWQQKSAEHGVNPTLSLRSS